MTLGVLGACWPATPGSILAKKALEPAVGKRLNPNYFFSLGTPVAYHWDGPGHGAAGGVRATGGKKSCYVSVIQRPVTVLLRYELEVTTRTDIGRVRKFNEDSLAADAARGFVALADGMAAAKGADLAASLATQTLIGQLATAQHIAPRAAAHAAFAAANRAIRDRVRTDPSPPAWARRSRPPGIAATASASRTSATRASTAGAPGGSSG
jgi:hypothetical protein